MGILRPNLSWAFLFGAAVLLGACDDSPTSHVYEAAPYSGSANCFGPSTPLGQVDTPTGDLDCAPTCLAQPSQGGANQLYVSTMCGPYPAGLDTSQTDPGCPAALSAWGAETAALVNGTNSCALLGSGLSDGSVDASPD